MASVTGIGWDNYAILSGGTVTRVSAVSSLLTAAGGATRSSSGATGTASGRGAELIDKAATNAGLAVRGLDSLRRELAAATGAGDSVGADQLAQLNQRLGTVRDQVDALGLGAQVGGANLLASGGGVTVTSAAGDTVRVASQRLDSTALGLAGLAVTDAASLRQAAGAVALATAQAGRIDYNLQVAKSVVAPAADNPGLQAYASILAAEQAGPQAGSALAAVSAAVDNQATVNGWYSASAQQESWFTTKTRTNSILDLFA